MNPYPIQSQILFKYYDLASSFSTREERIEQAFRFRGFPVSVLQNQFILHKGHRTCDQIDLSRLNFRDHSPREMELLRRGFDFDALRSFDLWNIRAFLDVSLDISDDNHIREILCPVYII